MTDYEAIARQLASVNCPTATQQAVVDEAAAALREADQQRTRVEQALVSGAEDMRKARNQILDMLVEIGNLREERDALRARLPSALGCACRFNDDEQQIKWCDPHLALRNNRDQFIEACEALHQRVMRADDRIAALEAERKWAEGKP